MAVTLEKEKIKIGAVIDLPMNPRCPDGTGWIPAKIVYIHPERRFCMAEFEFEGGTVRECFNLIGPAAAWGADK